VVHKSHRVAETCEEKVEKVKAEQREACSQQVQTAVDQVKHDNVLDKQKAVEEALQQSRKRLQQAEQVESGRQKTSRQKQFAPQQLVEQWRQKLEERWRQRSEGSSRQQQAEQQQKGFTRQQQLSEKELPQPQQVRRRQPREQWQDDVRQQPAEREEESLQRRRNSQQRQLDERLLQRDVQQQQVPVQQEGEEEPLQRRRNSQQRQLDERPLQRGGQQQQVPVEQEGDEQHGAEQQPNDNQLAARDDRHILQQSLQDKPEHQRSRRAAQKVAELEQKIPDELAQKEHRRPSIQEHQQPGMNDLQQQQQEQQKQQQPLVFQVPAPLHIRDYKQIGDDQRPKHDVQAPPPDRKQHLVDANRQQQFEQLQQDKLHEQLQSQKGLWFLCQYQ